ncbi:hypothetical protein Mbo2_114 [Rhodococcus phage Mbo2]|uniref:Uncharacterized protein n=1 Tax=Rhodococcus phage Mbo2 TaxID=2936911 RepID=A0A9E7LH69_9CAUD|nr:hypothetical protein Mbo2_114 [Rhodococcus phage Mbo2]
MSIKVDLETATREELVEEIRRQHEMVQNWANSWVTIVTANAEAWDNQHKADRARIAQLEGQLWVQEVGGDRP